MLQTIYSSRFIPSYFGEPWNNSSLDYYCREYKWDVWQEVINKEMFRRTVSGVKILGGTIMSGKMVEDCLARQVMECRFKNRRSRRCVVGMLKDSHNALVMQLGVEDAFQVDAMAAEKGWWMVEAVQPVADMSDELTCRCIALKSLTPV